MATAVASAAVSGYPCAECYEPSSSSSQAPWPTDEPAVEPPEIATSLEAESNAYVTRPWCNVCQRAARVCICASLPEGAPYKTDTEVVVLVHPKEVRRKCGTLPLLQCCLQDLRIVEGDKFPEPAENPDLHAELTMGGRRCALVCPGDNAVSPETFRDEATDEHGKPLPVALILIDGRWPQAKAMVKRSDWLQELPRVILTSTDSSGYFFRQQPQEGCLSTLEAVGEALAVLEGEHGRYVKAGLKAFFSVMVKNQVDFIPEDIVVDKNTAGGRKAFRKAITVVLANRVKDRDALPLICLCYWGERIYPDDILRPRRFMHIIRILKRMIIKEAEELCYEMSKGRRIGTKLFVFKFMQLPAEAIFEDAAIQELADIKAGSQVGHSKPLVEKN